MTLNFYNDIIKPKKIGVSIMVGLNYLPDFHTGYKDPTLSRSEKNEIELDRQRKMDEALQFLADFPNHPREVERLWCKAPCDNDQCNAISLIVNGPLSALRSTFCCFLPSSTSNEKKPIPMKAAITLEKTGEQFNRNTCGLIFIAPAVIIATPFITPITPGIAMILGIFTNLVILKVAGQDTYLGSGDIASIRDGERLIVQGGIRVDAINIIKDAYEDLADHLKQKWQLASFDESIDIKNQCEKILMNWHNIFHEIQEFGIPKDTVESILDPFSNVLSEILPDGLQAQAPEYFEIEL